MIPSSLTPDVRILLLTFFVLAFSTFSAQSSCAYLSAAPSGIQQLPEDSITAKIIVRFMVEKNGAVSKFEAVKKQCNCGRGVLDSLANEAKRIITENPPAPNKNRKGEPIESYFKQTLVFKLSEEDE